MKRLHRDLLEKLIAGSAEPLLVARIDSRDWPVILSNAAFEAISGDIDIPGQPLADIVEALAGRDLALEVSESIRSGQESSLPVEVRGKEYLLSLIPLEQGIAGSKEVAQFYAVYWRNARGFWVSASGQAAHQALLKAKRRIRNLSRDDPVTGLLNTAAFHDVLVHDWSVAHREKTTLALVAFSLDQFDEYLHVFGRHAADTCLRRVAQAIRRCLRRASDVAALIDSKHGIRLVVLSHASDEEKVNEFAARIGLAVRELGLHHPRSATSKYVTVSFKTLMMQAGKGGTDAAYFLERVVAEDSPSRLSASSPSSSRSSSTGAT